MNEELIITLLSGSVGFILGIGSLLLTQKIKLKKFKSISKQIIEKAEQEASNIRRSAELDKQQTKLEHQREIDDWIQKAKKKIEKEEDRLKEREDKLEKRVNAVEKKLVDIEKKEEHLKITSQKLDEEKKRVSEAQNQLFNELEKISGLSCTEAKELFIEKISTDLKTETGNYIRKMKKEAEEEAERNATAVICTAINRLAAKTVSDNTVNTVTIPSDEMKGRIIGREGRNIKTLERSTGVNFVVDDVPGAIVISGFDPVRIQIAKQALQELVADGRIHPSRIEETVDIASQNIQKKIKEYGEDAALRAGAVNLHPELITLLGKLKYRYSYGQNILEHSLEVSNILGLMASELGLDVALAKRIGLLHDIGKAVSHEMEGSHATVGRDLALRWGESEAVANGIGCHHNEIAPTTIEGSLCGAADAISASRPGARIEAVEEYVRRLKKLEELASAFPGVEQAYALQAGRELRVIVLPDMIDDAGTINLARDISRQIEKELQYPGKIKVTVIRERRAVEYAI